MLLRLDALALIYRGAKILLFYCYFGKKSNGMNVWWNPCVRRCRLSSAAQPPPQARDEVHAAASPPHHPRFLPISFLILFFFPLLSCVPFHPAEIWILHPSQKRKRRRRRRRARWDVLILVCKPHDRFGTCSCVGSFVNHILWIRYEIYPVLFCIHNNIAMRCGGETTTTTRPLTVGKKKKQEKRPNLFVKHFFFFSPFDSKYGIMFKGAYIL